METSEGNVRILKLPYSLLDFKRKEWNQENKWLTYDELYKKGFQKENLGYVLNRDKIVVIDLDQCIINAKASNFAKKVMSLFQGTYMEISQSGKGVHIFLKGIIPTNMNIQWLGIEMYQENRYMALTGNMESGKYFIPSNQLLEREREVKRLYEECIIKNQSRFQKKSEKIKRRIDTNSIAKDMPNNETVLKTMDKTNRLASLLLRGSSYTGDSSRDDFIFLLLLKNYTHSNAKRMEELFLLTPLSRLGTGEKRKNDVQYMEYLRKTIQKVMLIDGYQPFYWRQHHEYMQRIESNDKN